MNTLSGFFKNIFVNSPAELVMDTQLAADYNATRAANAQKSFCYAPSVNMYFSQTGEVKVCCHNTEYTIGTYPQQSIYEIWNSDAAKELRKRMEMWDLSKGCAVCEFDIKLRAFNQVQARHFDPRPRHADYPTMMEFLISNECNLECVMCVGEYSSLIRKNREQLPPLRFPYDKTFLKQLETFIPHLHEARFSGSGEAFLIALNYEIWEMIIRLNPQCVITVQTNGTVLTDKVKSILQRGNFEIGVSLDSLKKEIYETIRPNAKLEKVMNNIRWFSEYCRQKDSYFMLALCVMRQNVHELPAFIGLCNELNAAAVLHKVWSPEEFSLNHLPSAQLQNIYEELESFTYEPETTLQKQNLEHYRYFVSVIKKWQQDAIENEQRIMATQGLTAAQLMGLVTEKIKKHIDEINLPQAEKNQLHETFQSKFENVLARFNEADQLLILKMIYLENPAKVMAPMKEQPEEILYQNAKKNLLCEKAMN